MVNVLFVQFSEISNWACTLLAASKILMYKPGIACSI